MKFLLTLTLFSLAVIPGVTLAQEKNYLVGIPGVGNPSGDFDGYIQAIYAMFISIAALLAVVKIVIAGVKYMFTDIVPQKTAAKKDIQGALLGLVVVLGAVLILTVINPELTNFNIEQNRVGVPDPIITSTIDENDILEGFSDGNEFVQIDNGGGLNGSDFINSIVSEESCIANYGSIEIVNNQDVCVISYDARESVLPEIISENCPDGRICDAELCRQEDRGMFESCEEQCLVNSEGIYFDPLARACLYIDLSRDLGGAGNTITFDSNQEYFLIQSADEIAGGQAPQKVISVSPSNDGDPAYIEITLEGGGTRNIVCEGRIEPAVCEVNI